MKLLQNKQEYKEDLIEIGGLQRTNR